MFETKKEPPQKKKVNEIGTPHLSGDGGNLINLMDMRISFFLSLARGFLSHKKRTKNS